MTKKISLLSTKKLLPQHKLVLQEADIELSGENFIEIKSKTFDASLLHDNLIFTSKNAVESVLLHPQIEEFRKKTAFCVGIATKAFLEEYGFKVDVYAGYASDLAEIISLIYDKESFTFFSGNLRREVLPQTLLQNGIIFNEIEVYETGLTPIKTTNTFDGILFFSPSAVESYLSVNKIQTESCFCIGETTAAALEFNNIKNIVIANKPNVEEVILKIKEYYNR